MLNHTSSTTHTVLMTVCLSVKPHAKSARPHMSLCLCAVGGQQRERMACCNALAIETCIVRPGQSSPIEESGLRSNRRGKLSVSNWEGLLCCSLRDPGAAGPLHHFPCTCLTYCWSRGNVTLKKACCCCK